MNATQLVSKLLGEGNGKFAKYFVKVEDPYTAGYDAPGDPRRVKVYEFPTDELQQEFLDEVGGAPHPLGGRRVIISM